ncbi:type II secretion system protein [Romboutsia weinsteinii]|uniref:Type II secretion system protein n=1 Tax=Romboutsia weinsteinii TaxID=2020949 RepID=A0A371J1H3_9FIRM|nr:type II secretion system protein [Romboutsia weinsteinii]RDY26662.1 type II secretion system protein [Romboutsia weinsteinii]
MKKNKGFTLVELLVVIAIIGILAVVAVPALFKNINKAKMVEFKSDMQAFNTSAVVFYSEHNRLPKDKNELAENMEDMPTTTPFTSRVRSKQYIIQPIYSQQVDVDGNPVLDQNGKPVDDESKLTELRIGLEANNNVISRSYFDNDEELASKWRVVTTDPSIQDNIYGVYLTIFAPK